jgi:hypothetical protein
MAGGRCGRWSASPCTTAACSCTAGLQGGHVPPGLQGGHDKSHKGQAVLEGQLTTCPSCFVSGAAMPSSCLPLIPPRRHPGSRHHAAHRPEWQHGRALPTGCAPRQWVGDVCSRWVVRAWQPCIDTPLHGAAMPSNTRILAGRRRSQQRAAGQRGLELQRCCLGTHLAASGHRRAIPCLCALPGTAVGFAVTAPSALGQLARLHLRVAAGAAPWHLECIVITNKEDGQQTWFYCGNWIGGRHGECCSRQTGGSPASRVGGACSVLRGRDDWQCAQAAMQPPILRTESLQLPMVTRFLRPCRPGAQPASQQHGSEGRTGGLHSHLPHQRPAGRCVRHSGVCGLSRCGHVMFAVGGQIVCLSGWVAEKAAQACAPFAHLHE